MLTPEQRAELERRGWEYSILPDGYESVKKGDFVYWSSIGVVDGDISQVPELLAVLGIAPPGYRLVPIDVLPSPSQLDAIAVTLEQVTFLMEVVSPLSRVQRQLAIQECRKAAAKVRGLASFLRSGRSDVDGDA